MGVAHCGIKLLRSWASDQLVYGNEYKISKNKILSQYEDRYGKESMERFLANYEAGLIQDMMIETPITRAKYLKV